MGCVYGVCGYRDNMYDISSPIKAAHYVPLKSTVCAHILLLRATTASSSSTVSRISSSRLPPATPAARGITEDEVLSGEKKKGNFVYKSELRQK